MKNLIQLFIALFFFSTAFAQEDENWETYMAQVDKKPASLLVNLALYDRSPNKLLPYLLITGPKSKLCQSNGLPPKDEISQLEEILHSADLFITGVTAKALAGTMTYNCQRVNYYYIKDTVGIEQALSRMYRRSFKDYKYVYKIKHEPDWSTYRNFLYPNEENLTWIENNKIITKLITQGDSLTKPRNISFVLLFKKEEDRKAFIYFANQKEYKIDEVNFIKNADMPYLLKISKFDKIQPGIISQMSTEIKTEIKKYNGMYEGWTSELQK